jgi:hypothetical protein
VGRISAGRIQIGHVEVKQKRGAIILAGVAANLLIATLNASCKVWVFQLRIADFRLRIGETS